jgi:hypothetical protein
MCEHCHVTAIYASGDAVELYEEMKAVVVHLLDLQLNVPTGLALVDRNQLAEVIRQQALIPPSRPISATPPSILPAQTGETDKAGSSFFPSPSSNSTAASGMSAGGSDWEAELDPERTLGIYARRGMRRGIYVQTGLPRMLFLQVAAHEYAHAWQGETARCCEMYWFMKALLNG